MSVFTNPAASAPGQAGQYVAAVLELLATQKSEEIQTPEGKTELKKQIAERATAAFEHAEVTDVLFAEFVVQ